MKTYNFQVNDRVAIMRDGKVIGSTRVERVRVYKHRTKITTPNGHEYNQNGWPWDTADGSRCSIVPWSDEIEERVETARVRRCIDALRGDDYSPEQAARIVAAASKDEQSSTDDVTLSRDLLTEVADVLLGLSLSGRVADLPSQPRAYDLAVKIGEIVRACVRHKED